MAGRQLKSALSGVRRRQGLTQQQLADRAGVARQTLNAIEMGRAVPSTELALKLARVLACRVEDLFWIEEGAGPLVAELAASGALGRKSGERRRRVALGMVGDRWIAHPLSGGDVASLSVAADGLLPAQPRRASATDSSRARIETLRNREDLKANLLVMGCDPALGLLAARLAEGSRGLRLTWLNASSESALHRLARGHVHVAGAHLFDECAREFNVPFVRALFPGKSMLVVTLASWEEGFAVAAGNPLRIRSAKDLARPGVRLLNREEGAGARRLLDRLLFSARVPPDAVAGYRRLAKGHLEVAQAIAMGAADVGVVAKSAALAHGLDFIPLAEERFDLILPRELSRDDRIGRLLGALESRVFRRELASLGGYDTARSGHVVAEVTTA